jgi:lipopolysaccharide transport system permease protein
VPAHLLPWFHANPIAVLIESYRAVILGGHTPDLTLLGTVAFTSSVLLLAGGLIQTYFDKRLLKLTNV